MKTDESYIEEIVEWDKEKKIGTVKFKQTDELKNQTTGGSSASITEGTYPNTTLEDLKAGLEKDTVRKQKLQEEFEKECAAIDQHKANLKKLGYTPRMDAELEALQKKINILNNRMKIEQIAQTVDALKAEMDIKDKRITQRLKILDQVSDGD